MLFYCNFFKETLDIIKIITFLDPSWLEKSYQLYSQNFIKSFVNGGLNGSWGSYHNRDSYHKPKLMQNGLELENFRVFAKNLV